jgi:D-lactate dehydrogenase (cytochrome)
MISSAMCFFPSVKAAVDTVIQTIQSGIPVARIELARRAADEAFNLRQSHVPEKPTLWLEFHGTEAGCAEQAEMVQAIAGEHGGEGFKWTARRGAQEALAGAPRRGLCRQEAAARQAALGDRRLRADLAAGRLHRRDAGRREGVVPAGADRRPCRRRQLPPHHHPRSERSQGMAEANRLNDRLVARALSMDGTCTGEHGVGYGKIDFLTAEHGGDVLSVMRAVKKAIDPDGIMNPGKILRM